MSRYSCLLSSDPEITLNFGFDHALGYFYDIYNEDDEETIEEKCSMFNKLTSKQLLEVLKSKFNASQYERFLQKMERLAGYMEI